MCAVCETDGIMEAVTGFLTAHWLAVSLVCFLYVFSFSPFFSFSFSVSRAQTTVSAKCVRRTLCTVCSHTLAADTLTLHITPSRARRDWLFAAVVGTAPVSVSRLMVV